MGRRLLYEYSNNLTNIMKVENEKIQLPDTQVFKGYLTFQRKEDVVDVTSLDYFSVVDCFFTQFRGQTSGANGTAYHCDKKIGVAGLMKAPVDDRALPGIWAVADSLSKMFYWTILTDLGQTKARPNPLAEPELLNHFGAPFSVQVKGEKRRAMLGVSPSVVATSYLCQVPRIKGTGTLIVAVLINDIVLLSALWKGFIFLVGYFFLKPEMMVCEGCTEKEEPSSEERRVLRITTV